MQIQHISGVVDDSNTKILAKALDDGFTILRMDLNWAKQTQPDGSISQLPVMIAILSKYEDN